MGIWFKYAQKNHKASPYARGRTRKAELGEFSVGVRVARDNKEECRNPSQEDCSRNGGVLHRLV
jgi:hypothetical protein